MNLALFTPGAYIWPVERSFEAFVHSLGGTATDADDVEESTVYPAGNIGDPQAQMPAALSARLVSLHRQMYEALLRPSGFFAGQRTTSFSEFFYPDMLGTQVDQLVSALMFFFTRYSGAEITVPRGLAVLRAVFFNHEAADPALWVYSAKQRLHGMQNDCNTMSLTFTAPKSARVQGLSFALVGARDLPPTSPRMITAEARRGLDGSIQVTAECGLDPSLENSPKQAEAARRLAIGSIRRVFGWQEVPAA